MITDYTYCTIFGWMVKRYNLTGLSLIVYAILFSESQGWSCAVDWDYIKLCTEMKPSEVEPILQSFKDRGMIEYDGVYYKTINHD